MAAKPSSIQRSGPGGPGAVAQREFVLQILQDPEVVDRVDVARDDLGQRPDPRAVLGCGREEGRLREPFLQILDDGEGLREHGAVMFQGRNQALGILFQKLGRPLFAAAQVDRLEVVVQTFE